MKSFVVEVVPITGLSSVDAWAAVIAAVIEVITMIGFCVVEVSDGDPSITVVTTMIGIVVIETDVVDISGGDTSFELAVADWKINGLKL